MFVWRLFCSKYLAAPSLELFFIAINCFPTELFFILYNFPTHRAILYSLLLAYPQSHSFIFYLYIYFLEYGGIYLTNFILQSCSSCARWWGKGPASPSTPPPPQPTCSCATRTSWRHSLKRSRNRWRRWQPGSMRGVSMVHFQKIIFFFSLISKKNKLSFENDCPEDLNIFYSSPCLEYNKI